MAKNLTTESRNPASEHFGTTEVDELVRIMNREDAGVASAVATQTHAMSRAIRGLTERLAGNGRWVSIGAGTSGRLGVLDAAECGPTFGVSSRVVFGILAGGDQALRHAQEGAEDDVAAASRDLQQVCLGATDCLVAISASGHTPYTLAAAKYGKSVGAFTIGISCNEISPLGAVVDVDIRPIVGPEVLTGSTRLKAGTATKLVLNTLSTGTMVMLGKTQGNLMTGLRPSNDKLRERAIGLVVSQTGLSTDEAHQLLDYHAQDVAAAVRAHREKAAS